MSGRLLLVLGWLAVAAALVFLGISLERRWEQPRCTHGVSSVGPVTVTNGRVVGDTTPHTERCE